MLKMYMLAGVATVSLCPVASAAQAVDRDEATKSEQAAAGSVDQRAASDIIVQAKRQEAYAGTKTETPLIEVPQPLTVITSDTYLAQGAISIADTVRYAAGVSSDSYGRDTRVDSFTIRGVQALQFRDGMRDDFSYYASITSDPYNFSRVEVVRGPASVLFGQGSIGGIVNLVSKTPVFTNAGEVQLTYGSFDRKEVLADLNLASGSTIAGRIVARVRDSGTQVDHVPDDRVMIAPSVTWRPGVDTDVTLLGLYQKDNGGSTLNFLPIVGTVRPNRDNPRLSPYLFVGKPGYDRYDGRLLQGSALLTHRFSDKVKISLKTRYNDSNLSYFTHYTNSYSNPTDPYLDSAGRTIGLYADSSLARLNVFTTDNNIQARFNTGAAIEHTLLAGIDYSWNRVRKAYGSDYQVIDIYNIDYDAIATPQVFGPFSNDSQKQLGLYVQDQIRLWDRVSVVLGARRDHVTGKSLDLSSGSMTNTTDNATTFRAGIIGEVGANISPFFSYTENFQPIVGTTSAGTPFKPSVGNQYETGFKWQLDRATLLTATAFRIRERNRVLYGPGSLITQAGLLTTKGIELEATRTLPGQFEFSVAYGYNDVTGDDAASGYLAKHIASIWSTKTFTSELGALRLGTGVRYTGKQTSRSDVLTITTPDRVMVDALVELTRDRWRLMLNANNLLNKQGFASCLARGDCFPNAPRNVMLSLGYHF